jgi:hypothetical protein
VRARAAAPPAGLVARRHDRFELFTKGQRGTQRSFAG